MQKEGKLKKSLRFSFLDGVFASCMSGLTADYITPYALALKATTAHIGILTAAPNLAASLVQLKAPDVTERVGSRRKIINTFVFLHALMFLPMIAIPYLSASYSIFFLIICVTLFTSFNAFAGPAWSSLMSDHIPFRSRGKFFGWRNKTLAVVTIVFSFIAGLILHHFRADILKGFLIILGLAFVCRLISWYFLTQMYEPPFTVRKEAYFSFLDFIRRFRESNFAKFVIFMAAFHFSVNVASPFFSVFMLRDLKFNYLTYTILVITVTITQIFTLDRWGRHADKVGNVKVLKITSLFIASLPLMWVACRNPVWLVFAQTVSGFAWAGFTLCLTNFIYDAVTPQKRVRCIAYFNVFVGLATFSGALLGGFLANKMPPLLGFRLLSLFLLGSLLRFGSSFLFFSKIKEVRTAEHVSSKDLFYSVIGIRPMPGLSEESQRLIRKDD